VLQLRDNIPTISAPGQWSFFGGKIEEGETPLEAVKREVYEEITLKPKKYTELWPIDFYSEFDKTMVRSWLFTVDVADVWVTRQLREGKDANAFDFEELSKIEMPTAMREALIRFHNERMNKELYA